ncbi:hypothetical protein BZG36_03515 [Bifiguratus adelaidae]|uniref:RRM domain-containing protein n=1 Tax=Bifiguratus adelaidae TaxID=1938954 RepID=A0A261XY07_9FUNG|nr:hypothetical protein BZG36_03515 [Bifiguratus adelaidae]
MADNWAMETVPADNWEQNQDRGDRGNGDANGRSRSRSPSPRRDDRDEPRSSRSPPPHKRSGVRENPEPSRVLGVFGLSLRTTERDLEDMFGKFGDLERVVVVYDHRSQRSRGFGFITFREMEGAELAREKTNGIEVDGRVIRVDFSVTKRAHTPTPGQYMGERRRSRDRYRGDRYGGDRDRNRGDRYAGDRYGERRRYRSRSRSPRRRSRSRERRRRTPSRSRSPGRY